MDHIAGTRTGRSCSLGSRIPQWNPGKGAPHVGTHDARLMQASAGRSHAGDNARMNASRESILYLAGSKPSLRPRCHSPVPSIVSTPTTCSFGTLSSHSPPPSSAQTSPTPTGAFCHSRESTLVLDVGPSVHELEALGALLKKTSISAIPGGQHRVVPADLDMSKLHRHRRIYSDEFARWWDDASRASDFDSVADGDEDLRTYRQDVGVTAADCLDAKTHKNEDSPTVTDIEDDHLTAPFSEADDAPELDDDGDNTPQADRVAKELLGREFGLFLGSSEPPQEAVKAVYKCLDEISLSVRASRSVGVLPAHTTAAPATESPGSLSFASASPQNGRRSGANQKKRPIREHGDEEEGTQDDEGRDGHGLTGRGDIGHRKRPKVEQYPCPFRKRSPYRFNCREWEFCAKAPFKTMTELKKHIIKYHQQQQEPLAYACVRCHAEFVTQQQWESHMLVSPSDMCEVRGGPRPPPEIVGITSIMAERLRSRSQHFDWDTLWRALFPSDLSVPEPDFEPVVELHEVDHEYRVLLPEFQTQLHSILDTLWPGADPAHLRRLQVLIGNLENLFKESVATAFGRARTHASENSPNPQAQRAATDTPSPAPPRAASVPTSRPSSFTRPRNPRVILPNPAHRLSDYSSTDTSSSPSSVRYSTSTTSFGPSNRESLVSNLSSQGSLGNIPPPLPTHRHHHHPSSFHARRMPLREASASTSTSPSTRSPLRELPPQTPPTAEPPLRDPTVAADTAHKRHQPRKQEDGVATGNAKPRDARDSAVCDMDMDMGHRCFGCLGDETAPCHCGPDGETLLPSLSPPGAGICSGLDARGAAYGLGGSSSAPDYMLEHVGGWGAPPDGLESGLVMGQMWDWEDGNVE